jgi:hypothetical protein
MEDRERVILAGLGFDDPYASEGDGDNPMIPEAGSGIHRRTCG